MADEAPIACTLNPEDLQSRIATARQLGERALVSLDIRDRRALLRFRGDPEGVDALVAAESVCCAFFDFATVRNGQDTELEIRTPEGGEALLRGLVAGIVAGWEGGLG
jgi:hypothetical protein